MPAWFLCKVIAASISTDAGTCGSSIFDYVGMQMVAYNFQLHVFAIAELARPNIDTQIHNSLNVMS